MFLWLIFHVVAIVKSSFSLLLLFPDVPHQLLSVNANFSVGTILKKQSLRKHFPWFNGAADSMTGGDSLSLSCLSDGYFYIYLPPIFMCLLSVVLMYLSKKKKKKKQILCVLLSSLTMNIWPQRANESPAPAARLYTYMLLLERELLFVRVLFQNCSLVCMYTFFL